MKRGQGLARLFRSLSGLSLKEFARKAGIHPGLLLKYESGQAEPTAEHLRLMGQVVSLTVKAGEEILAFAETRSRPRSRAGHRGKERIAEQLLDFAAAFEDRLLAIPVPPSPPGPEDRDRAREQWELLKDLPDDQPHSVLSVAREFQSWALVERVCEESVAAASRDVGRALYLAELAAGIAERIEEPEGFAQRLKGFTLAHWGNALRVSGELHKAEDFFAEARKLWAAGSDPAGLLDPGRLLDLEASLCRAQRRFEQALDLLEEACTVGRHPGRYLIKKGFTLEAVGDHAGAIETLLQAEPLVDRQAQPRLWYKLRANLAVNLCHVSRYDEAAGSLEQARQVAAALGDELDLCRLVWLEGRIAAGLGRREEALELLRQARQEFARREMWYDVALALLEEAVLLLESGQAPQCKELARDLARVFEAEGVHREALAALRLFREAADHEVATADLARRVLTYLFRARYDEGVRYGS